MTSSLRRHNCHKDLEKILSRIIFNCLHLLVFATEDNCMLFNQLVRKKLVFQNYMTKELCPTYKTSSQPSLQPWSKATPPLAWKAAIKPREPPLSLSPPPIPSTLYCTMATLRHRHLTLSFLKSSNDFVFQSPQVAPEAVCSGSSGLIRRLSELSSHLLSLSPSQLGSSCSVSNILSSVHQVCPSSTWPSPACLRIETACKQAPSPTDSRGICQIGKVERKILYSSKATVAIWPPLESWVRSDSIPNLGTLHGTRRGIGGGELLILLSHSPVPFYLVGTY